MMFIAFLATMLLVVLVNEASCQPNLTTAADWYKKGDEAGDIEAPRALGLCDSHGEGIPRDFVRAWVGVGYELGHGVARI